MKPPFYKTILTGIITGIFVISAAIVPFSLEGRAQEAHAQGFGILVNDVQATLTNTIQTLSTVALQQKELVLDPLFYQIAQMALKQLTSNILKFINSGFNGDPAFITDLNAYLNDAADESAGNFIYGGPTNTTCTPYKLDVQQALTQQVVKEEGGYASEGQCTFDDPSFDQAAFLDGNFSAGGWSAWFEMVLNPQDSPVGAFAKSNAERVAVEGEARSQATTKAIYNNGFKDLESCTGTGPTRHCTVTTPGSLIQGQANFALQIPALDLLNANEFNEIVGSLFSNLATQAFDGVNGLLGLGGNSTYTDNSYGSSGTGSYLDSIGQESTNLSQSTTPGGNQIQQALVTETNVLQSELAIVSAVDDVTTTYNDAKKPYASSSCWTLAVPTQLTSTQNTYVAKVPVTVQTVLTLQNLSDQYDKATGSSQQLQLLQQLTQMQTSGKLEGETAVVQNDYLLNSTLKPIIDTFKLDIKKQQQTCSA